MGISGGGPSSEPAQSQRVEVHVRDQVAPAPAGKPGRCGEVCVIEPIDAVEEELRSFLDPLVGPGSQVRTALLSRRPMPPTSIVTTSPSCR